MQGFVWVILFTRTIKAFCYPALLWMDGFFFSALKESGKSEITAILLTEALYVCIIYICMACSFADGGYLQQLFRLLQGQTKIVC